MNAEVVKIEDRNTLFVDLTGHCVDCGARLTFKAPGGLSYNEPRTGVMGFELRCPATLHHDDGHAGQYDERDIGDWDGTEN